MILDQTRLPWETVVVEARTYPVVIEAIKMLRIRGAPALGIAAAYGIALGAKGLRTSEAESFHVGVRRIAAEIVAVRPTAVNMAWAAKRMLVVALHPGTLEEVQDLLVAEATRMHQEDVATNRRMGENGAVLIPDGATVLTHCNTGSLATAGYGTALGVIRSARAVGKTVKVFATETRPLLQGARLTAWELVEDGFDVTLITDSMIGTVLASGRMTCAIVGADRIAMNGDVANKIGTYTLAVVAKEHGVPFYVAAPVSTLDPSLESGAGIPIEQRKPEEVTNWGGVQTAPLGVKVENPAFDVTPARYVSAIVTEKGVARAPYQAALRAMVK